MSGPKPLKCALTCRTIRVRKVQHETCQALPLGTLCGRGGLLQAHLCVHSIPLPVGSFHEGRGPAIPGDDEVIDPQVACRWQVRLGPMYENAAPCSGGEHHEKTKNHPVPDHAVCSPGCEIRTFCRTESAVHPSLFPF